MRPYNIKRKKNNNDGKHVYRNTSDRAIRIFYANERNKMDFTNALPGKTAIFYPSCTPMHIVPSSVPYNEAKEIFKCWFYNFPAACALAETLVRELER